MQTSGINTGINSEEIIYANGNKEGINRYAPETNYYRRKKVNGS
jgi:hypothetical protein